MHRTYLARLMWLSTPDYGYGLADDEDAALPEGNGEGLVEADGIHHGGNTAEAAASTTGSGGGDEGSVCVVA